MSSTFAQLLALAVSLLTATSAKKVPLFEKDHQMDTVFPPLIWKHPDLPAGHLRSLGHQRHPDGPLKVSSRAPTAVEFFIDNVDRRRPVVVRDALDQSAPVVDSWTDDTLRRRFGSVRVSVTHKKELLKGQEEVMPLSEFLNRYKYEDLYMATLATPAMEDGIQLPKFVACGPVTRQSVEAELWMSSGGTGSLLHYHSHHQLHCVADGRKDFILIEPQFKDNLRCEEIPRGSGNGRSTLDVDMINGFTDPQVQETPWRYATLLPRDCLLIPAGHLHQVRSYGRSLSFTLAFRANDSDRSLADCRTKPSGWPTTLSELPLTWTMDNDGFSRLRRLPLTPERLRLLLKSEANSDGVVTFANFRHFYEKATARAGKGEGLAAKKAFRMLAQSDKKQVLTTDGIDKLPSELLNRLVLFVNSLRPTVKDEL